MNLDKLTAEQKQALSTIAETLLSDEKKPTNTGDTQRFKFSTVLLTVGIVCVTSSYFSAPVLFIPSFCVFFVGLSSLLLVIIDKFLFPETNTFERISEDARATALIFFAFTILIVGGVVSGAALVQVPPPPIETAVQDNSAPSVLSTEGYRNKGKADTLEQLR